MSETYNGCDTGEYIAVPGPRGPQGQQGIQGQPGPTGPQGPQGIAGPMGPAGCQGPKGDRGPAGPQGPQGEQGIPGLNGRDGARGPEGPRGCTGASGKVAFENLNEEQREMLRGPRGYTGAQGAQGPRGIQGFEGPEGPPGPIGPNGATGPAGAPGAPGERGPMGPRGLMGPKGDKGEPGNANVTDQVTHDGAWSGKHVVDYVTNGKVDWERHSIEWGHESTYKVTGTENGYAKDIVVTGKTIRNFSTVRDRLADSVTDTLYFSLKNRSFRAFDHGVREGDTILQHNSEAPNCYTLIYKVDGVVIKEGQGAVPGAPVTIDNFESKIGVVTVPHEQMQGAQETEYIKGDFVNGGYVKFKIPTRAEKDIIDINVFPVQGVVAEPDSEAQYDNVRISYNVKDVLLLKGDYTNKVPPEYFSGEKGVGINRGENRYEIKIESMNKNLIDVIDEQQLMADYYLWKDDSILGDDENIRFRSSGTKGTKATYKVYCKPNTDYIFTMKRNTVTGGKWDKHLVIAGFNHDPGNGELGHNYCYKIGPLAKDEEVCQFRTNATTNILIIYLANFESSTGSRADWHISERCKEVMLEEGTKKTSYEPYRTSTRSLMIQQQLKEGEYLYWNEAKKEYYLKVWNKQHDAHLDVETGIKEQGLIHTYNDTTYVYIRSKISSTVTGTFPIKAHNDYYHKSQTQSTEEIAATIHQQIVEYNNKFEFRDIQGDDSNNYLSLPNGFVLGWQEVVLNPGESEKIVKIHTGVGIVIHSQATLFIKNTDLESGQSAKVTISEVTNDYGRLKIHVDPAGTSGGPGVGKYRRVNLLYIIKKEPQEI